MYLKISVFLLSAKDIVSDVNPLSYVTNNVNSIVILDVTCDQVRNVISSLNNSSAGYDELPPFVAKSCVDGFIEPIIYMVNESLKSGICPSELKLQRLSLYLNRGIQL